MQPTKDTLGTNIRAQSIEILNRHLAAAIDLHAQVKQAHWNVRGPNFIAIHQLFDKLAGRVEEFSDTIAERATALGGVAHGTIEMTIKQSFLVPYVLEVADEKSHLFALSSALAAFGGSAREAIEKTATIGDPGTADVFTEISRGIDFELWLLESHSPPDMRNATHTTLSIVKP